MDLLTSIFSSNDNRELEYIQVSGKYQFHVEPVVRGVLPYHSCTVMITCFKDSRKLAPIDFKCEWFRVIEERIYKIEDNETESYNFTPYDIGASIKVKVTSQCVEYPGTANIILGPVKMDLAIRNHVRDAVLQGVVEFKTRVVKLDDLMITDLSDYENKTILNRNEIGVVMVPNKDINETQLHIPYEKSILFRIDCDSADPRSLTIFFEQDEKERQIKLQFISRVARDLFVMAMRVVKTLRISCVTDMVNNYGKILSKEWLPKKLNPEDGEEFYERFMEDEKSIRSALKMTITANKELNADNEKLMECIEILEGDLQFSIAEFTSLLQEMKTKGNVDLKRYEDANKNIAAESSEMLEKLRKDPNSSFHSKRNTKDQNVHSRKIYELEQLSALQTEYDNCKRLNSILETELMKLRSSKVGGNDSPTLGASQAKAEAAKLTATMNLNLKSRIAGGGDDDDDNGLGMTLENVLADLEDVDYKTYKITKEEIEKYKETMRLRMEFTEEKRSAETIAANIEFIKNLKQNAIKSKASFDISALNLPPEAAKIGLSNEQRLVEILMDLMKQNKKLMQQNYEASKANLESEQSCDQLIELKLKYLLKKTSTLDEQSEKAEEELTNAIIERFRKLDQSGALSKSTVESAALENQRKANAEISAKIRAATLQNEQKAKELEAEKAKNAAVKADLEKLLAEKKVYTEKAEKIKKLQAEVTALMEKASLIQSSDEVI